MTLSDIKDRLTKLETDKLIDISKNYKQYGYDNETRNYVLNLLKERNVSIEDLRLTGNIGNNNYEQAVQLFDTFKRNSTSAFFFYLVILLFKLSVVVHFSGWTSSPAFYSVIFYAAIAG
jgi:hypothetical protein